MMRTSHLKISLSSTRPAENPESTKKILLVLDCLESISWRLDNEEVELSRCLSFSSKSEWNIQRYRHLSQGFSWALPVASSIAERLLCPSTFGSGNLSSARLNNFDPFRGRKSMNEQSRGGKLVCCIVIATWRQEIFEKLFIYQFWLRDVFFLPRFFTMGEIFQSRKTLLSSMLSAELEWI